MTGNWLVDYANRNKATLTVAEYEVMLQMAREFDGRGRDTHLLDNIIEMGTVTIKCRPDSMGGPWPSWSAESGEYVGIGIGFDNNARGVIWDLYTRWSAGGKKVSP